MDLIDPRSNIFIKFFSVLFGLYTFTFLALNCQTVLLLAFGGGGNPKGEFSFYIFIMNNNVLL